MRAGQRREELEVPFSLVIHRVNEPAIDMFPTPLNSCVESANSDFHSSMTSSCHLDLHRSPR